MTTQGKEDAWNTQDEYKLSVMCQEKEEENNSVQTNQSLCDDGSRRRPGEDFNLTRSVNQHIPAEVKGQRDKLSVKQRGWRGPRGVQLSGEPRRKFKSYKLTDDSAASSLWTASPEGHKHTRVLSLFSPVLIMISSEHVTSRHLNQNSFTQKADNIF